MSDQEVLCSVNQGVATITLNRPEKLNALSRSMQEQYFKTLGDCDIDDSVRAIVVTGAGGSFCSGADFGSIASRLEPGTRGSINGSRYLTAVKTRKPVIAAIDGHCVGIGLLLACACDIRFAGADVKFGPVFSRRGLSAEEAISWLLPRIVGLSNSLDILLSGRLIEAEEAKALGLVNRIVHDNTLKRAQEYAGDMVRNCSPTSMATIKRAIYRHAATAIGQALIETRVLMADSFDSPDPKEGFAALREKRAPNFPPLSGHAGRPELDLP